MFRLILLLLGNDFVRRRWLPLALLGLLWAVLGIAIFIDALDGQTAVPTHLFGYLLVIEAVVTLAVTPSGRDTRVILRKARGLAFLVLGLLVIDSHHGARVILGMVFGVAFLADGAFRVAAAAVVRFRGWKLSLVTGLLEIAFAGFMFEPYPTHYEGTVAYCIGMGLLLSGAGLLRQALRLRRLPPGASVSLWLARDVTPALATQATDTDADVIPATGDLVVHVWTPTGSAELPGASRPVVDRYIAAVDGHGVVSTGHAALDAPPGIYVSHYPNVEIDRSGADFARMLRATDVNDVEGKFQPSYAEEAAGWCDSTAQVHFEHYNRTRLTTFWRHYGADKTYNLTRRNCSSSVAHALDAALEGTLYGGKPGFGALFRAMLIPELWFAAQLHRRAQAMAWTPGLVLDYARTLKAALNSAPLGWYSLLQGLAKARRHAARRRPLPSNTSTAARKDARAEIASADTDGQPPAGG